MENSTIIFQRLRHSVDNEYELAEKYYSLLSVINDLGLTKREVQLVSFMAINGNVSYSKLREDFCNRYDTTVATFNNLVCKLNKLKVLIRDKKRARVNPGIVIDFIKPLRLEINMMANETR